MAQQDKKVFRHQPDHWINKPSVDAITDSRLDYFDRCLLLYMVYRFDYFKDVAKKPYFESVQTLATVFNVHRNTVSRAIQTLRGLGYVELTSKKGGSNTYTKVTTWLESDKPVSQECILEVPKKSLKPTGRLLEMDYDSIIDDPF